MEERKSWFEWFIEDWQKYNHALVLLFYLYPIFMIFTVIPLIPQSAGCIILLIIGSNKIPVWRAIVTVGSFICILTTGLIIQWFWDRKKPIEGKLK